MRKVILATLLVVALAACADGQGAYVNAAVQRFTPGVTTRAEAIQQLGPPSSIYDQADGSKTLSWVRNGGLFNESETRSLSIAFGSDDKMTRVVSGGPPSL